MKYFTMKKGLSILLFLALFSFRSNGQCVDTLYVNITEPIGIDTLSIDIEVANFKDIFSMQWTMIFDPAYLEYVTAEDFGLSDLGMGNFNLTNPGELRFSWNPSSGLGETVDNGTSIYSVKFASLQSGDTDICFSNDPIVIEIVNGDFEELCLNEECTDVSLNGAVYSGNVTAIVDGDCANPNVENVATNWLVRMFNNEKEYLVTTDAEGFYSKVVIPDDYTISVIPPTYLWGICDNNIQGSSSMNGDVVSTNFKAYAESECPYMEVDVSAPFVRRCFDNYYSIDYCNQGTITANDAFIELELDEDFSVSNVDHPDYSIDGNILTLNIGDVPPSECGSIDFQLYLDCEVELGETQCVNAHIYPDTICNADALWSGASVEVKGVCEGDSVRFYIENIGDMDMLGPVEFIVTEDDVMFQEGEINLDAAELTSLAFNANGSTYRINVNQVEFHPGFSSPTVAVEACGTNNQGSFSIGYVNMFSENEQNSFLSVDCQETIGSYDPNDKRGYPVGYQEEHYIKANTDLEYKIRFQNVGTDTAFRVVIVDTISEFLNVQTIRPGASSHDYDFSINDRVVQFVFNDIDLVDSLTNEAGSHGFVKFKVSQNPNNLDGSLILNSADIYFDFNDPVKTNNTDHLVGSDFIESVISGIKNLLPDESVLVRPHPVVDFSEVKIESTTLRNATLTVYNLSGQRILEIPMINNSAFVQRSNLQAGMYTYEIRDNKEIISLGKLIVQ